MAKNDDIYKTRETLLERIRNQYDENSWEDFVFYYKKFIYVICRRMSLNHHDAEEVVQKVLLYSWNKLPEFVYDEKKKFRGWLCQMTMNAVKDFYKSTKRYNNKIENASIDQKNEDIFIVPDVEIIAEEEWNAYIANMAMHNIKGSFSDKVLEIFQKLSQGGTPTSLADETGIPRNTISVYKKRVTAKLCDEIRRLNHELG